jgi:gamma-glutamyltranspeptidase/glutathione hydrolase
MFKSPTLAQTFRQLAEEGAEGFYKGRIGETIISTLRSEGGYHTLEDLQYHLRDDGGCLTPLFIRLFDERTSPPIEVDLWEHAPNSQGVVALMALGVIRELEKTGQIVPISQQSHNSARYVKTSIT